jgi:hypothetical protein
MPTPAKLAKFLLQIETSVLAFRRSDEKVTS